MAYVEEDSRPGPRVDQVLLPLALASTTATLTLIIVSAATAPIHVEILSMAKLLTFGIWMAFCYQRNAARAERHNTELRAGIAGRDRYAEGYVDGLARKPIPPSGPLRAVE